MNVMVTGNLGYIGHVMVPYLVEKGYTVIGLDTGYFEHDEIEKVPHPVSRQIRKDIRDVEPSDFEGIDAVIHLAALSNDPIGELNPALTESINLNGTMRVAECAKKAGVKRFLYASSPSMYGISEEDGDLDENAKKNPLTAYARTKWEAEQQLRALNDGGDFFCTYFRPSTAYGASPFLRSDLVFNNFMGCAFTTNKIEIKSDGTPWRPLAHVKDISAGFEAGLAAPREILENRPFHIGVAGGNYTVREIAEAVQRSMPGSDLTFSGEHADSRSYKVSFDRILTDLKDYYHPEWNLDKAADEQLAFMKRVHFDTATFTGPSTNRLKRIKALMESGKVDENLRWKG